jgi:hypothetical protein
MLIPSGSTDSLRVAKHLATHVVVSGNATDGHGGTPGLPIANPAWSLHALPQFQKERLEYGSVHADPSVWLGGSFIISRFSVV